MSISLILSTKDRVKELGAFLESLRFATAPLDDDCFVELIVSDQNDDDRLVVMLSEFARTWGGSTRIVKHIRSSGGLSRGRNAGLKVARGALVGFPDDDCTYAPNTLRDVLNTFAANPLIGFLGVKTQDSNAPSRAAIPQPAQMCGINARWAPLFSPTLFVRRFLCRQVGRFDEDLGVGGSIYGAGEETDYVYRLLQIGALGVFIPTATVFHPAKSEAPLSLAQLRRQASYGRGMGKVLLKHKKEMGYFFWVQLVVNSLIKPICALPQPNRFLQAAAASWGVISGTVRWGLSRAKAGHAPKQECR